MAIMAEPVLLLSDPAMLDHDPGPGHPERAQRLAGVVRRLREAKRLEACWEVPVPAPRAAVERVHAAGYVDRLESLRGRTALLDADTRVTPGSVPAARLAAGAALDAVEAAMAGRARRAFAVVRPPGHHAERARAMGFCLFNNVAVAAAHAVAALGCRRVLVVDWDVHHGNGTQHLFEERRDVLFFDTHQFPLYPGTGEADEVGTGAGEGFTVNVPMQAGCGDAEYEAVFRRLLVPIADAFGPDLILVSAGFDSHRDDPLGGMTMTDRGFAELCGIVRDLADRHAGGRLVLVLEGGYDLEALAGSALACALVLGGEDPPPPADAGSAADRLIDAVRRVHSRYWPV